ncbi:MAG: enoyl-CoA hydratase/isomerase family protein [Elusimicrobia bacterium]|nr:enoyl-CoA hydratase/isomerase family protein [Elusimicrobiota bacterium]
MRLVSLRTEAAVTTITLERPEALNALSEPLARGFAAAVARARREASKVVVVQGAGRAFCAGGDLAFIAANRRRAAADLAPRMRRFYGSFLSVRELPQVTIAKVQGAAVGAGLCLALACDLRAVAPEARLGFNFVRLGLNPGMAAWPLARAVLGEARARELLFTGRFFSGRDLLAWGGASASGPAGPRLDAACARLARSAAAGSGAALRALKAETRLREDLAPFLDFESRGQARAFLSPDLAEGLAAARERRAPRFDA